MGWFAFPQGLVKPNYACVIYKIFRETIARDDTGSAEIGGRNDERISLFALVN